MHYQDFNISSMGWSGKKVYKMECHHCSSVYTKSEGDIHRGMRKHKLNFCSNECACRYRYGLNSFNFNCSECGTLVKHRYNTEKKKSLSGRHFCNSSCAAKYNNAHKTTGTRRSKIEKWLESEISLAYPAIAIEYNNSKTIGFELDIYIPPLHLAFELNGIFHYEPIYGDTKLNRVKEIDVNKFSECQKRGISLCVIDISSIKRFKPENCFWVRDIITKIINENVSG